MSSCYCHGTQAYVRMMADLLSAVCLETLSSCSLPQDCGPVPADQHQAHFLATDTLLGLNLPFRHQYLIAGHLSFG